MEDKVRIKNLKSLLAFFEKFSRVVNNTFNLVMLYLSLDAGIDLASFGAVACAFIHCATVARMWFTEKKTMIAQSK